MSETATKWGPWPPESASSRQMQNTQPYTKQSADQIPGQTGLAKRGIRSQTIEHPTPTLGIRQPAALMPGIGSGILSHQVGQDRLDGSAPTTRNLVGSDFETDREWHASTMGCGEGWANDPTWSQYRRAKPTYADPEDDTRIDAAMSVGIASKT